MYNETRAASADRLPWGDGGGADTIRFKGLDNRWQRDRLTLCNAGRYLIVDGGIAARTLRAVQESSPARREVLPCCRNGLPGGYLLTCSMRLMPNPEGAIKKADFEDSVLTESSPYTFLKPREIRRS